MCPVALVHLSDIHFTATGDNLAERRDVTREELLADLATMRSEVGAADAVLVTGDIASSAQPEEYELAAQWFDKVAAAVGTDRTKILTVPGNHDVNWKLVGTSSHDVRTKLRRCNHDEITPTLDELLADVGRPLLAPLDNYNVFAQGYGCTVPANGRAWEHPLRLTDRHHLRIRGITTVFNSDWDDNAHPSTLVVGRTQMRMRPIPGAVRLIMAHHGPDECRDKQMIRDELDGRAALLLCGHLHDQRPNRINGCLELTGAAVHPEEQYGFHPTYNWLRLRITEDERLSVELWQRQHRPDTGYAFVSVADRYGRTPQIFELDIASPPSGPRPTGEAADQGSAQGDGATAGRAFDIDDCGGDSGGDGRQDGDGVDGADGAITREPLMDESGQVPEERHVARALLDLPMTARLAVLLDCTLLNDADLYLTPATMLEVAMMRAVERGKLRDLAAAIAERKE